ncbi:MAG: hypothetical protein AAGA18_07350 [Verrucomicrobiota bacterium]
MKRLFHPLWVSTLLTNLWPTSSIASNNYEKVPANLSFRTTWQSPFRKRMEVQVSLLTELAFKIKKIYTMP